MTVQRINAYTRKSATARSYSTCNDIQIKHWNVHISTSLFRSRFDSLHVCRGSPFTYHVTWKALRHMPTSHCTHTPVLARAGSLQSWHAFCPQRSGRISSSTTQLSWLGSMKVTPGVYKQHTMCTHLQGIHIYTVEDTAWTQYKYSVHVYKPIPNCLLINSYVWSGLTYIAYLYT